MKPQTYARLDDEANMVVNCPKPPGIIQASWNRPSIRIDFEVYGEGGYAIATGGNSLRVRLPRGKEELRTPAALEPEEQDSISDLTALARSKRKSAALSSLENNMIVTEILEAERESARTGRTVKLQLGVMS